MLLKHALALEFIALLCSGCGWVGRKLLPIDWDGGALQDGSNTPANDALEGGAPLDAGLVLDAEQLEDAQDARPVPLPESGIPGSGDDAACVDMGPHAGAGLPDAGLILRYDFDGVGTTAIDRISDNHGQILGGAQLDCSGGLELDGEDDFVDMPNALISPLTSASLMIWLAWDQRADRCWERAFALGSSDQGEGNAGFVQSSVSMTVSSCIENLVVGMIEVGYTQGTGTLMCPSQRVVQLTLVVDGVLGELRVYLDGAPAGRSPITHTLSQLRDVDNWLGRSNWIQDSHLRARLEEFRIYAVALHDAEVLAAYERGADNP